MTFEIFSEGLTVLNAISFIAFFSTVGLFLCGFYRPICRQIWKRKDTKEISGAPFIMGAIGGSCWWTYGYLKSDPTVLCVSTSQIVLYSSYLMFYWSMSKKKLKCALKVTTPVFVGVILFASVQSFHQKVYHPLGVVCIILNVADFTAPLAGINNVIRKRSTQTLPMPLCIGNFLVSSEWCIYGILKRDFYLILPNGIGSVLAAGQLVLFLVLPRKTGEQSPLINLFIRVSFYCNKAINDTEADVEVMAEADENALTKYRWSDRVIANVTEEIGNVLKKCKIKDQFAYSDTLNTPSESMSYSSVGSAIEVISDVKNMSVPRFFSIEKKLGSLGQQLLSKLEGGATLSISETRIKCEVHANSQEMKRTASAPNLCYI